MEAIYVNRKPWAEFMLILLGSILYFMANLQRVAVPGAMFDLLMYDLKTTAQTVAAFGSIFMYSYAIGQLIIGVLVARFGGFRVVTAGSVLFFTGSLIFPFAHSLPVLYISRFMIGLGSASYYIGMINETRRLVSKKNFGLVLSLILFIGYLGGIVANAPMVVCMQKLGWRSSFVIAGIITTAISLIFIILNKTIKHVEIDKTVHLDFELFKIALSTKSNYALYTFSSINYGLYYVIQTVIGKKFLEDFCLLPEMKAASVLSAMCFMYAIAGSIIAFLSRMFLNRCTIFLRISGLNALIIFGLILMCLCLDIKTSLIAIGFCIIAFGASLSPLLVTLLHDYNEQKVANTAVSIMTCLFYVVVAVLGSVIGYSLDYFSSIKDINITRNSSYIAIFGIMFVLSVISFINVFKIAESKKTERFVKHAQYLKEHGHYYHG